MNGGRAAVPRRFYSLDVLRGVAALCVVFWHWQHFFFVGAEPTSSFVASNQPLFGIFLVFYKYGWLAVDLFFSLSGFIFYWLYSNQVSSRAMPARDFLILRFSRLYPLHLLTLLWVAILQFLFSRITDSYFVYPLNDPYHFLLNLSFASSWGLERGYSFNGPVWSVSVEVALYFLFFVLCRFLPIRAIVPIGISIVGFFVVSTFYSPLGRGLGSFFLGGCMYLTYNWIVRTQRTHVVLKFLPWLVVGLWIITIVAVNNQRGLASVPFLWRFTPIYPVAVRLAPTYSAAALFPLTILALALIETRRGTLGRRISFLGDISYSSYLLHFPLQLSIATIAISIGADRSIFYSPVAIAGFFAALLAVSYASFRYFERPAQRYIRGQWLTPRFDVPTDPKLS